MEYAVQTFAPTIVTSVATNIMERQITGGIPGIYPPGPYHPRPTKTKAESFIIITITPTTSTGTEAGPTTGAASTTLMPGQCIMTDGEPGTMAPSTIYMAGAPEIRPIRTVTTCVPTDAARINAAEEMQTKLEIAFWLPAGAVIFFCLSGLGFVIMRTGCLRALWEGFLRSLLRVMDFIRWP